MIIFKKLRYQNILSTGNMFTEIDLNRSKSTLIVGENGAGKSTMIEALTFGLYGRPFRNINKPQLINSITGKKLLVEVEFEVNNKSYMVRRGIKPNVFDIYQNEILINQHADAREYQDMLEKNILKLNFKSFSQIVVLGSASYVPFMQLPAQHRRGVVEDFLDIQIFSVMNSILKNRIQGNREELQGVEYHIDVCEQKIEMHEDHISSLKKNHDELINQKKDKIEENRISIDQCNIIIEEVSNEIESLQASISDGDKWSTRKAQLLQLETSLEDKSRKLNREIQFFHDHDNCPTCKQGIDHDFKMSTVETRSVKRDEIKEALNKIDEEIKGITAKLEHISNINACITDLNSKVQGNNNQIRFHQKYINDLQKDIELLMQQSNRIDSDDSNLASSLKLELKDLHQEKKKLIDERQIHDVAQFLLKDGGIKTKIIKQYVPIMNKLINKYLASMDFFVNFQLDESFNETILSRFRDDFSYASFSEGEKLRIDLALMFTWRAIAKLRNSASTNLLIMDEVFDSSLDVGGTEEFLKILDGLTGETNTFIISHKGDQLYDKFHSVIRFEKHKNFSRISQ